MDVVKDVKIVWWEELGRYVYSSDVMDQWNEAADCEG